MSCCNFSRAEHSTDGGDHIGERRVSPFVPWKTQDAEGFVLEESQRHQNIDTE